MARAPAVPRTRRGTPLLRPLEIGRFTKARMLVNNINSQIKMDSAKIDNHAAFIFANNPPTCGFIVYAVTELANGTFITAASVAGPSSKPVAGIFHGGVKVTEERRRGYNVLPRVTRVKRTFGNVKAATVSNVRRTGIRI